MMKAGWPTTADQGARTRRAAERSGDLAVLAEAVAGCGACARLVCYREDVARQKVKRHLGETYWGRAVPGFGDPAARILIVGLAPAAHGANRTGRMFTGDRSGDFLYAGLHRAGLANQAESRGRGDGLLLRGVYIGAAARCAPPENRPTPQELDNCRPYLLREMDLLPGLRVVLALGAIGHDAVVRALQERGIGAQPARAKFRHGAVHEWVGAPALLDCYHVSQQNTFTGRLTPAMLDAVLSQAREIAGLSA
jgi:uracil-DNA glycosylase family 4